MRGGVVLLVIGTIKKINDEGTDDFFDFDLLGAFE
jgi:hypothetical protein